MTTQTKGQIQTTQSDKEQRNYYSTVTTFKTKTKPMTIDTLRKKKSAIKGRMGAAAATTTNGDDDDNDNAASSSNPQQLQLSRQLGQQQLRRSRSRTYSVLITCIALFSFLSVQYNRQDFRLFLLPSISSSSSSTTTINTSSSKSTTSSSFTFDNNTTSISRNNDEYCFYESTSSQCCSKEHCETVVKQSSMALKCCNTSIPRWPLLITDTPRSGTVYVTTALRNIGLQVHDDWGNPQSDGMVSWIHVMYEQRDEYFGPGKLRGGGKFATVYHLVRDPLKSITSIAFTEPLLKIPQYLKYLKKHIPLNITVIPRTAILQEQAKVERAKQQRLKQKQVRAQGNKNAGVVVHKDANGNDVEFSDVKLSLALEFYIQWHTFIDALHVPRFRLEDFSESIVWDIYQTAGFMDRYNNASTTAKRDPIQNQIYNFFHSPKVNQVKNSRKHRSTVTWKELCNINKQLTNEFWTLVRGYGYYLDMTKQPCS